MKGVSLSINAVIIIVLALLVLGMLGYMFITGMDPFKAAKYESALNNGCKIYMQGDQSVENILVGDLTNNGASDSLLVACRLYYSNETMEANDCEQKCRDRYPFGG